MNCIDSAGKDAIWLQDEDAVGGAGHTGLLIQDANGNWYHVYWGKKDILGVVYQTVIIDPIPNLDCSNLESINSSISSVYGGEYEGAVYMKGDFSKGYNYLNNLLTDYDLLSMNCMQVSIDALMKGTFASENVERKLLLSGIRNQIVPNIAYLSVLAFQVGRAIPQNMNSMKTEEIYKYHTYGY